MPLLRSNPVEDPTLGLRPGINPYMSKLKDPELPIHYGPELGQLRGTWRQALGLSKGDPKLWLEIGCHKGRVLLDLASKHPEHLILGMDITFKRVVTTAERIKARKLRQARVLFGNARHLDKVFAAKELDGVLLFFPDPWTKKEHQLDRRLVDEFFEKQLRELITVGGFLWFKSDSESYAQRVSSLFSGSNWELLGEEASDLGLVGYQSSFEEKFQLQGLRTYSMVYRRL